jgi:predicted DNA-binding transcriptional regulator AlpA
VTTLEQPIATKRPWLVCGISKRQWFRLQAAEKTPAPARLGDRNPVWLISELREWIAAGAPDRAAWGQQKECEAIAAVRARGY